jgi:hypothetical protein
MKRYPLMVFLHGFAPGGDVLSRRLDPPPVSMPPPMRTAEELASDLEYLRTIIDDANELALEKKP